MERPVTSKARGICRYYDTPRGCFAGDKCKFLHGADEKFTPYDKAKVCRYYVRGLLFLVSAAIGSDLASSCSRSLHPGRSVLVPSRGANVTPQQRAGSTGDGSLLYLHGKANHAWPVDHVFCLSCIRQWRDTDGKSLDMVATGAIKSCPLCRRPSRFVTPSTYFLPSANPQKDETIDRYKASMAKVPCKYFEETSLTGRPCCPFGSDCFYKHTNPDGTPHVFPHGAEKYMVIYKRRRQRSQRRTRPGFPNPMEYLQQLFDRRGNDFYVSLDMLRTAIPSLLARREGETAPAIPADTESEQPTTPADDIDMLSDEEAFFSMMLDDLVLHQTLAESRNQPPSDTPRPPPDSEAAGRSPDTPTSLPLDEPSVTLDSSLPTPTNPEIPSSDESASLSPPAETPASEPGRPVVTRFSTVLNSRNHEMLVINVSDDEEEGSEAVSPSDSSEDDSADARETQDTTPVPAPVSSPSVDGRHAEGDAADDATTGAARDARGDRAPSEHNNDPPFMTDGRGRVVWSSPCNGRGAPAEGEGAREVQWSRAGSTTKSSNAVRA
ncbi:hypothetical protein ID866_4902 [Astraeus odoratus]|nr:hypothetical protein ID866_4902 [Astraeus odoratus]